MKNEETHDLMQPHQFDEPQETGPTTPSVPAEPATCPTCRSDDRKMRCCSAAAHSRDRVHDPYSTGCETCKHSWHDAKPERIAEEVAPRIIYDGCSLPMISVDHEIYRLQRLVAGQWKSEESEEGYQRVIGATLSSEHDKLSQLPASILDVRDLQARLDAANLRIVELMEQLGKEGVATLSSETPRDAAEVWWKNANGAMRRHFLISHHLLEKFETLDWGNLPAYVQEELTGVFTIGAASPAPASTPLGNCEDMEECKECGVIEPVAASTEKMSAREYWIAYWNDHKEEQWRLNLNEAVWHFAEAYAAYCGAALPVAGQELKLTVAIPCPCCKFPECGHKHEMTGALQKAHEEYYAAQDMKRELSALREKLAHANEELRLEEQSHDAEMKRLAMELNGGETVETEELVKAIRKLREKLARALKAFEKIVELDENHLHTEGNMALGNARVVAEAAVADLKGDGNAS